jgi:hypothetical protein
VRSDRKAVDAIARSACSLHRQMRAERAPQRMHAIGEKARRARQRAVSEQVGRDGDLGPRLAMDVRRAEWARTRLRIATRGRLWRRSDADAAELRDLIRGQRERCCGKPLGQLLYGARTGNRRDDGWLRE